MSQPLLEGLAMLQGVKQEQSSLSSKKEADEEKASGVPAERGDEHPEESTGNGRASPRGTSEGGHRRGHLG